MAWIEINDYILPGSCFTSIAVIILTFLRRSFPEYDPLVDASGSANIAVPEVLALLADTALSIGLMVYGVGAYKHWSAAFTSVLPEVYLVAILTARSLVAAQAPYWTDHLQLHSAALYTVRFSCACLAVTYSLYHRPSRFGVILSVARISLLGTLVLTLPPSLLQQRG